MTLWQISWIAKDGVSHLNVMLTLHSDDFRNWVVKPLLEIGTSEGFEPTVQAGVLAKLKYFFALTCESFENYFYGIIFQSHEHFKILASFLGTAKWKTRGRLSSELWCTWWRKATPTSSSPNLSTSRQIRKLSSQRYSQVLIFSWTVKMHKDLSCNEAYIFKSFVDISSVKWKKS